jgi:hypothetical protein
VQGWAEDASNVDNCCYCSDKLALLFYFFKSSRTDLRSISKVCCFPSLANNNVLVMFQAHCYSLFAVSAAHRAKTAHTAPSMGGIHWCHLQGCAEKLDEKQVYIFRGNFPQLMRVALHMVLHRLIVNPGVTWSKFFGTLWHRIAWSSSGISGFKSIFPEHGKHWGLFTALTPIKMQR